MSLIKAQGAGEVSTGFYSHLLDQSLKFNDDDAQYLTRTPASAGNRRTFTLSMWFKLANLPTADNYLFGTGVSGSATQSYIYFNSSNSNKLTLGIKISNSHYAITINPLYRDTSAWYHLVYAVDTTQSTDTNRVKIYVNGSQVTDYLSATYPPQNGDTSYADAVPQVIGANSDGSGSYFDGYIAEVNFIDGTALTPASFGETVQGIWTPKDTSGLTFGTNGFHLTFKDDVVSEGFNTVLYTGTGATQSLSGVGFQPDLVWIKRRNVTSNGNHFLWDSVRGATYWLESNSTDVEQNASEGLKSFDGDGFTLGSGSGINNSGDATVAWCWEAGGAPTATNSAGAGATPTAGSVKIDGSNLGSALAGSIPATKLSANTARGFSIVTYTGTGSVGTVAHGLGATPKWIMIKNRDTATWFNVYHTSLGATKYVRLNSNVAEQTNSNVFNNTEPTSSVFTVATVNDVNASGEDYVAYVWSDISGYSKFGSYTGNGSATGPSVTLGFAPAWIMIKNVDNTGDWQILDNTRNVVNPGGRALYANTTAVEDSGNSTDFTSTGFQIKNTYGTSNTNNETYIYMAFADTREAAFFKDVSSNGNHITPVNLDYRDSVPDVPTNNFATANPLHKRLDGTVTVSEGNLQISAGASYGGDNRFAGTTAVSSGKWYFEMLRTDATGLGNQTATGVFDADTALSSGNYSGNPTSSGAATNEWALTDRGVAVNGSTYTNLSGTVGTVTQNKVVQVAVDMDNKKIWFGIDNTFSGDPAAGSGEAFSNLPTTILPMLYTAQSTQVFNFGQDSSFAGNKSTANSNADGNGRGSFQYAPPSGYLALCSQNLPDAAIIDGTEHFDTALYTGNSSTQSITSLNFSPDWLWIKDRSVARGHVWEDVVRGAGKFLQSNTTSAEGTSSTTTQSFDANGFTQGSNAATNNASETYAAWSWLAGTAFSNDASATGVGTIDSTGQINTKAGFSIISYTGNGTDGATVAHGLSQTIEALIVKRRDSAAHWQYLDKSLSSGKVLLLSSTVAESSYSSFSGGGIDNLASATFSLEDGSSNGDNVNASGGTYIAYCFHSVEGYSKVGSYVGNGNADGPYVHLGFRPIFVLLKESGNARNWVISYDHSTYYNGVTQSLFPNIDQAEDANTRLDFLSNGFKLRTTSTSWNNSSGNFIYLAFADQPFKFSNAR